MFMGESGHAGTKKLELVIVLVFAHHLVGNDPGADDSKREESDYNVKGHPIHNLKF